MKFLLLTVLFTLILYAQGDKNPKVYTAIGNELYDNAAKIEKLKNIKVYSIYTDKIDLYINTLKDTKILGYEVESGKRSNVKLDYLYQLRKHKKLNDYFLRSVNNNFHSAMDKQDNELFTAIVNSGLLNLSINKKKILAYYKNNSSVINPNGVVQKLLNEEVSVKKKKRWKKKTKKQLQAEKIKRLKENDRLEQEALEKKLSEEVKSKKEKLREEQERELFN